MAELGICLSGTIDTNKNPTNLAQHRAMLPSINLHKPFEMEKTTSLFALEEIRDLISQISSIKGFSSLEMTRQMELTVLLESVLLKAGDSYPELPSDNIIKILGKEVQSEIYKGSHPIRSCLYSRKHSRKPLTFTSLMDVLHKENEKYKISDTSLMHTSCIIL